MLGFVFSTLFQITYFSAHAAKPNNWTPPPHLHLGVDLGYSQLNVTSADEIAKSGMHFQFRMGGVYYFNRWLIDSDLGFYGHTLTGVSKNQVTTGTVSVGAFIFDLSPRWQISPALSLGPSLQTAIGSDLSYSPKTSPATQSILVSGGFKSAYQLVEDSWAARVIVAIHRSFNLPLRSLWNIVGGIEFGIPVVGSPPPPEPKPTPTPIPTPTPTPTPPAPTPSPTPIATPEPLVINLEYDVIRFETGSWKLLVESEKSLKSLGKFLGRNPSYWSSLRIDGHADRRGDDQKNILLSRNRALAVAKALIQGGAPEGRLTFYGYGSSKPKAPLDEENSWKVNRRVELTFFGVRDDKLFQDAVESILNPNGR